MRKKVILVGENGRRYVCHNLIEVAKFILFAVSTGKVKVKGKLPKLKKSNPKVKALIELKRKHFKDQK